MIKNIHQVVLFFNLVSYPHINTIWKKNGNYLSWLGWKVDEILWNMHHIIIFMWGLGKRNMILYEIGIGKKSMRSWDRNLIQRQLEVQLLIQIPYLYQVRSKNNSHNKYYIEMTMVWNEFKICMIKGDQDW